LEGMLPTLGRGGLAAQMVAGSEFRGKVVGTLYGNRPTPTGLAFVPNLLRRPTAPTAGEVAGWVNSGLDVLGIEVAFAASAEYFRRAAAGASPNFIESVYGVALL